MNGSLARHPCRFAGYDPSERPLERQPAPLHPRDYLSPPSEKRMRNLRRAYRRALIELAARDGHAA